MCLKPDIKDVKSPELNIIIGPGIGEFRDDLRNIFVCGNSAEFIHSSTWQIVINPAFCVRHWTKSGDALVS